MDFVTIACRQNRERIEQSTEYARAYYRIVETVATAIREADGELGFNAVISDAISNLPAHCHTDVGKGMFQDSIYCALGDRARDIRAEAQTLARKRGWGLK